MQSSALEHEGEIKVVAAATDFTDAASAALRRAALLCRANGSQLHLIHVMSRTRARTDAVFGALGVHRSRLGTVEAASALRRTAARLAAEFGVRVETHLRVGSASRQIAALAREADADLIVLGNHKRNFLAEVLGINTALRVQHRVDIPLLAISKPAARAYASLLFVSDLSEEAARAGQHALRLFPGTQLTILHATESLHTGTLYVGGASVEVRDEYRRRAQVEAMGRLQAFARDASLSGALRVELAPPTVVTQRIARNLGVDLVVLRPTRLWLTSGVAYYLAADPPCDLLLMP